VAQAFLAAVGHHHLMALPTQRQFQPVPDGSIVFDDEDTMHADKYYQVNKAVAADSRSVT
jgi:hypothetical protein